MIDMKKIMKRTAIFSLLLMGAFLLIYKLTNYRILFPFVITFGTIAYHFIIRLTIGTLIDLIMKNKADHKKKWYQVSSFEMKLYKILNVKKWKNKMPTYDLDTFDVSKHTWEEIIGATCQSELVHEVNAVFSFLPVLASIWFDSFWVFLITSAAGAVFDMMFVCMQRFNRSRILKINKKIK